MGVDADLVSIFREIVQFLESLCDVDLPSKIENVRNNLLQRSKTKLATFTANRGSTSPEPYLDMNAGKGLLLFSNKKNTKDPEIEEYVGVDERPLSVSATSSHQDYYESFQQVETTNNDETSPNETSRRRSEPRRKLVLCDEQFDNKLREIYRTFTAAKMMTTAQKFGPVYHKVERKPFGFVRGNVRHCWIGLVGSHLLMYGSEDDKQPPEICSIRGYSARPAPNALPRDPERAKSAFEIFCPGNKTLQFIARTPREMEEWIAAISRTSTSNRHEKVGFSGKENIEKERSEDGRSMEEKYQDIGEILPSLKLKDSSILEVSSCALEAGSDNDRTGNDRDRTRRDLTISPPALPVRIPRRLPSLPSEEAATIASYEPLDDAYGEDDIYHKIEDFRENGRSYENVKKTHDSLRTKKVTKNKKRKRKEAVETETYDDVENKGVIREEIVETYDDVRTISLDSQDNNLADSKNLSPSRRDVLKSLDEISQTKDEPFINYDDVFQTSSNVPAHSSGKTKNYESKESAKQLIVGSPASSPTKSPQKRSFLDRVRHRKDSPKKEKKCGKTSSNEKKKSEKKEKTSISLESPEYIKTPVSLGTELDLPTYDDVSELTSDLHNCRSANSESMAPSSQSAEISNYNCPPPPRPIYAKPPSNVAVSTIKNGEKTLIEEVYDDIGNWRDSRRELVPSNSDEKEITHSISEGKVSISVHLEDPKCDKNGEIDNISPSLSTVVVLNHERKVSLDSDHYQTPRANSVQVNRSVIDSAHEELYDDIAILADFRAKQRESASTSSSPKKSTSFSITNGTEKLTISTKKAWNRFGSGKKVASRDSPLSQDKSSSIDFDEFGTEDDILPSTEKHEAGKLNKLQKLINKMESTLGKPPSTKSTGTFFNKTNNIE